MPKALPNKTAAPLRIDGRHRHHLRPRSPRFGPFTPGWAALRNRRDRCAVGGSSTLLDGLVAYWPLDETSGPRLDMAGDGHDLTDNNSVGYDEGVVGNAASLYGPSNQYLSIASSPALSFGDSDGLSVSLWVNFAPLDTYKILISKWGATIPEMEFNLQVYAPAYDYIVDWQVSDGVSYYGAQTIDVIGDGWWHIVGTFDAASGEVQVWLNGVGSPVTSGASLASAAATPIVLGAYSTFAAPSTQLMDETALFNRRLTPAEIAQLYNGGDGLAFPFG